MKQISKVYMDSQSDCNDVTPDTHIQQLFSQVVPLHNLYPAMSLLTTQNCHCGGRLVVLASDKREIVAVYIPSSGSFSLDLSPDVGYTAQWFSPKLGAVYTAHIAPTSAGLAFTTPDIQDDNNNSLEWFLTLSLPVIL